MRLIFLILFFSGGARAENFTILFEKDSMIEIGDYDPDTHLFEIKDVVNYGQGPYYSTSGQIAHAVSSLTKSQIDRSPSSIVSSQFKTDHLMYVVPQDVADFIKNPKPAKKK